VSGKSGGGVYVTGSGTFTMHSGAVSDNSSYGVGGVYVAGTFTMHGGGVSGNFSSYSSSGGGVYVNSSGTFTMHGGAVSDNSSSSSSNGNSGVYIAGTFTMYGGAVSGNSSFHSSGGGVYVAGSGIFTMHSGAVSANSSYSSGGGVYVGDNGTFTMHGGAVSDNSSLSGGSGVYVDSSGTFTMHGGTVSDNILSGGNRYGKEVQVNGGIFIISENARPERVFLYDNTAFIAIGGPLSGGTVPIDLGITGSASLSDWLNRPVLKLDDSYSTGNLASLKEHFTLENAMLTESPYTETPLTGYKIDDDGLFVAE
jgi:hypothetical protein